MRVVAINESWRLCPWADVLYACDGMWWKQQNGVPDFKGIKLCQDGQVCAKFRDLHKIDVPEAKSTILKFDKPGVVGSGLNSGFQALNLVAQFGAMRILLIGFDMNAANGVHWHGPHRRGLCNPNSSNFIRWRLALDDAAATLRKFGIEVINASQDSVLTGYPKMTVEAAMQRWGL